MSLSNRFTLYSHSEFRQYTRIINVDDLEYFIWLKIPTDISNRCELFQIDEILPTKQEFDHTIFTKRECGKPWIRVITEMLNKSIGQHIYKFSFIDRNTDEIETLYFSYIIHNDNPDKPYIYMRREGK